MTRYSILWLGLFLLLFALMLQAQVNSVLSVKDDKIISPGEVKKHVSYLASDELRGRGIGTVGIRKAAEYIAEQFRLAGLNDPSGLKNYLQPVGLENVSPAVSGVITMDSMTFKIESDFVLLSGKSMDMESDLIFAGHGLEDDYNGLDVKGRFVMVLAGDGINKGTSRYLKLWPVKQQLAREHGAKGVIELVKTSGPWYMFTSYHSGSGIQLKHTKNTDFFYAWVNDYDLRLAGWAKTGPKHTVSVKVTGVSRVTIPAWNVIGILEGSDPVLKNEYVTATAHYDHLGTGRPVNGDSIYNGARDNAIGVASIMMAAKYLKAAGTKRSVIFIAFTGEEEGMLGSEWYVSHPVVDLKNTIFNLNTDGAGYDDKSKITLIDQAVTTFDNSIERAAALAGLKVGGDPAPEQQFYRRSDNISFAMAGVPAVDICPGVTGLTDEIMKYYHQPQDEVGSLDFDYLADFVRAYSFALEELCNMPVRPFWKKGNDYEKTGLQLYGSRP